MTFCSAERNNTLMVIFFFFFQKLKYWAQELKSDALRSADLTTDRDISNGGTQGGKERRSILVRWADSEEVTRAKKTLQK